VCDKRRGNCYGIAQSVSGGCGKKQEKQELTSILWTCPTRGRSALAAAMKNGAPGRYPKKQFRHEHSGRLDGQGYRQELRES